MYSTLSNKLETVHLVGFHYKNNPRSLFWCIPIGSFATTNMLILSHNSSYMPQSPHSLDMLNLTISDDEEFLVTQIRRHVCGYTKQSLFHTYPVSLLQSYGY